MKFDQYVNEGRRFVKEISQELGNPEDSERAERVMTAVLHTLRDLLSPEESLHVISQLPMLIKAIYVNGWHLSGNKRIRSMDEFIECLMLQNPRTAPQDFGNEERAKEQTKAVFRVLRKHVSAGEVQHIIDQFPEELSELWMTTEATENS